MKSKISVILPCFNEESLLKKNLCYLLDFLEKMEFLFEIIIVDDGSSDPIKQKGLLDRPSLQIVRLDSNQGKGCAIKTGFQKASGDIFIFCDCDIPYYIESLPEVLELFVQSDNDIAIGYRDPLFSIETLKAVGPLRFLSSFLFRIVVFFLTPLRYKDTQCGLKVFKAGSAKVLFKRVNEKGYIFDLELLYLSKIMNKKVMEFPLNLRDYSPNNNRLLLSGLLMFRDVWSLSTKFNKEIKRASKQQS